mgnify:CR=1 FL=1
MNHTRMNDTPATELPKIIVSRSVAAEGFRNILTLNVCHIDSVHVEYNPDFMSYPKNQCVETLVIVSKQLFDEHLSIDKLTVNNKCWTHGCAVIYSRVYT